MMIMIIIVIVILSGESGAGKTENTKKVISYFAQVAGTQKSKDEEEEAKVSLFGSVGGRGVTGQVGSKVNCNVDYISVHKSLRN